VLVAAVLLILAIWSLFETINAFRPIRQQWLLFPSFVVSLITIELPAHFTIAEVVIALVLIWLGALDVWLGWPALVLLIVSWVGRFVLFLQGRGARRVVNEELALADIPPATTSVPRWRVVTAFPFRPKSVERIKNIEFRRVAGKVLRLDVYRPVGGADGLPVMLYLHGGAWTVGDKREQGLPMIHFLAESGWFVVSANYRLSPGATFPDHLIDAKAAVAWIRDHSTEYGADPSFLAVSGGSAGGHIAALLALTPNEAKYQPGFEGVDTAVQAAVPIYGVYDLTDRLGVQSQGFVPLLMEPIVMKGFLTEEPERYREASPIDLVGNQAPPFLVIQGERDTLAPVEEARAFVDALRRQSAQPVIYMELPGAQHVFDLFYSLRTSRMIEGVLAFLEAMLAKDRSADEADEADEADQAG